MQGAGVARSEISQSATRYLRSPRLRRESTGRIVLEAIAWEGDSECVVAFDLAPDGAVTSGPAHLFRHEAIPLLHPQSQTTVSDDIELENQAADGDVAVRIERDQGRSRVIVRWPDGEELLVWAAQGTACAPSIVAHEQGAWIAFHHNVREDTNAVDLAKWIALRYVDRSGAVYEPAAAMTDRDRDREGEDQGFEFPSLVLGRDGALAIFGRSSHRFYRQDLNQEGFLPRLPVGSEGWGCRGRRVAVISTDDHGILLARRERSGIVVERQAAPTGGPPALVEATVRYAAVSAPRVPRQRFAASDGRSIFFGDIHQHSAHSDGCGTAEEPYLRAKFVYDDDFCALTDHESFLGKRLSPGEWAYLQRVARKYDEPGRFVALLGYEWTGRAYPGPGHKVVYLPEEGLPVLSRDELPDGAALLERAAALGAFAVPHHVGWTGADLAAHDPNRQPVWEICSCHGCYESFGHKLGQRGTLADQMVDAVLATGLRFGLVAASDGHGLLWHHGVARKRDSFRTGLTAVQSPSLDRKSILSAIRERRCYATSGAKIVLDATIDAAPMGAAIGISSARRRVDVRVIGTESIGSVELVTQRGVIERWEGKDRVVAWSTTIAPSEFVYLYVRVEQTDGEMAWSSPFYLDAA